MSVSHVRSEKTVDAPDVLVGDEIRHDGDLNTVARVVEDGSLVTIHMVRPDGRSVRWIYTFDEPVTVRRMVPKKSVSTDSPESPEAYVLTEKITVGELWTDSYQGYVSFDAGWLPVVPSDLTVGSVFVTMTDLPDKFDMVVCSGTPEQTDIGWIIPTFTGNVGDCAGMVYARA